MTDFEFNLLWIALWCVFLGGMGAFLTAPFSLKRKKGGKRHDSSKI